MRCGESFLQNAAKRVAEVMPFIDELIAAVVNGYREVARILNASDRPSPRGGRWHASSVRNAMRAAERSFPAKPKAAPPVDHPAPVPQIRIVRPASQRERQVVRERYREAMAALAAPRLGPVQKQAAQILAYKAEGLSAAGIARVLGVSLSPVLRVLRAAGLAGPQQTTQARLREKTREKILLLRRKGNSGEQIARELNLPVGRVYNSLHRASGLDPRFNLGTSHLTSDELKTISELRTQQVSISEIAQRLGRSERTIFRAIAKLRRSKGFRQPPPPSVDRG
jgi:DNA-directed RNA polymerase specialized sigma24 family protein